VYGSKNKLNVEKKIIVSETRMIRIVGNNENIPSLLKKADFLVTEQATML